MTDHAEKVRNYYRKQGASHERAYIASELIWDQDMYELFLEYIPDPEERQQFRNTLIAFIKGDNSE